jgi:hypothetical protein
MQLDARSVKLVKGVFFFYERAWKGKETLCYQRPSALIEIH